RPPDPMTLCTRGPGTGIEKLRAPVYTSRSSPRNPSHPKLRTSMPPPNSTAPAFVSRCVRLALRPALSLDSEYRAQPPPTLSKNAYGVIGMKVNRRPGVKCSVAYSSGNDAPGVTAVNAGDAIKGSSIDRFSASVRQIRQANVA